MGKRNKRKNGSRPPTELELKVLSAVTDPKTRAECIRVMREKDWIIFKPRKIDFEKLQDLLQRDPVLRAWLEHETDPVLIAERLVQAFPEIFYTIEHVFEVHTDWKLKMMKKAGFMGGNTEPPPIPGHLLEALDDDQLAMVARRLLRKQIKMMNEDPKGTIKAMREAHRKEKHRQQKQVYKYLIKLMTDLAAETYPAFVHEIVPGKPFPSMHVRLWVRQIRERGNALIVGDVGTQKTSAATVGLDALGCRDTVIICRSYAKEMWEIELKKYHRETPTIFVCNGSKDLPELETLPVKEANRRFIVVGYGNVQIGHTDEEDVRYSDRLVKALMRLEPDAVVIDEAHAIKGNGGRAQRVLEIARCKSVKHRIMLTATPFENNPNEVAHIATLLDPENFPDEHVFLAMCRDNPRIFFGLMSQRMCDYFAQSDVLKLPKSNLDIHNFFPVIRLPCPPDMARVHERIQEDGEYEARQMVGRLTRFLSVPFAARDWYPELRNLPCFTDPLANPKLAYLKDQIAKLIQKEKVVIASGIYASGITRALEEEEDESAIAGVFERWFPGKVLRIDGASNARGFDEGRDEVVRRWKQDPNARILIASVPAAAESLDFTLKFVPGSVEKISIFYLAPPWKPTQYLQFNGRFLRSGAEVPIEVQTLVIEGTADEALVELNERKWRNFLIGVYGMPILAEEERAIEDSAFRRVIVTPNMWLREAFAQMLSLGEEGIQKLLASELHERPVSSTMAEYYLACEEQGTPGDISRVTVPMLQRWKDQGVIPAWEAVLDVGSGPLLLERRLKAPLYAIDINQKMIELGAGNSEHGGKNAIVGRASVMPADWTGQFDFLVASLMLDLTSPRKSKDETIERVRVLQELHRVLNVDGHLWCVFQERCFTPNSLKRFVEMLGVYGFEAVDPWCNMIESVDQQPHRFRFWSILVRKKTELHIVNPPCPLFEHELTQEAAVKRKQRRQKPIANGPVNRIQHELFAIRDEFAGLISLEEASLKLAPPPNRYTDLHQTMVERFSIEDRKVSNRLMIELEQVRPRSLNQLKMVWRSIRTLPGAPRASWAQVSEVAKVYFSL